MECGRGHSAPFTKSACKFPIASTIAGIKGLKALLAFPLALPVALLAAQAAGQTQEQPPRAAIVVDNSCLIQPESDLSPMDDHNEVFRAAFIVHHNVPENWTVDSYPPPSNIDGSTAVIQFNAEPRQSVRLRVGLRGS